MELSLQFGYGMMDHTRNLLEEWNKGTVILSPRDLSDKQLQKLSSDVHRLGGEVLLDPQFYLPHSDHKRLIGHDYWPADYQSILFWSGSELTTLLTKLQILNNSLNTDGFILPGLYADRIDDDWLVQQTAILEEVEHLNIESNITYATIALSGEATSSIEQIHKLLDSSKDWPVMGIYLICEHPRGEYLVQDPNWLANILDLTAGFRLRGRNVILGYCNQQMLIASCSSASAIASGTWMNVRSFPPEKFRTQYEEEIRQRTTWFYSPEALSEFKIPFLDIAYRQGLLSDIRPSGEFSNPFNTPLFSGSQPTTVGFSEHASFRNYLHCLQVQISNSRKATFEETVRAHYRLLDDSEALLKRLHSVGVRGQMRDFFECLDANRAALAILESTRGPILKRAWVNL